ncbi:MAG TPA: MFS transporter [Candidatus Limnocylindrales bacterium]|jgi:PPP family 3-phenylpropionic acid transporter
MHAPATGRAPWSLRVLFLGTGAWVAAVAPFVVVMLRTRGLDTVTIGVLSGGSALVATLVVPAWGHLADVLVGRALAFRIGLALAICAAIVLVLPVPLPAFALTLALFSVLPILFLSLADALAVDGLPAPERQYGALRALMSLAFAVGVIVAGIVYDAAGYAAVPWIALAWSIGLLVLLGWVPDRTRDPAVRAIAGREGGESAAGRFGSVSRVLAVQPRFLAVLAVFTLAYTGLQGSMVFLPIRIVELGGQPSDVALTYGIASFAEVPGLVLVGWLGRRIGIRWLVVLAFVAYGLCVASWGVLPTPIAINVTRLITGVCFGLLAGARVLIVARLLPEPLQATGQAMGQAATSALGSAFGGLVAGVVYGGFGAVAFFGFAGVLSIAGGLGAWLVLHGRVGAPVRVAERPVRPALD